MSRTESCIECGTMSLPTAWLIGNGALCDGCATRLSWHLEEARQLADLVGLTLDQLRLAVSK